jgi:membrane protease YdiL (CAAX protease family)
MNDPRRPDHVDAVRAMFFALLAASGVQGLVQLLPGWPSEAFRLLLQGVFFAVPLLYAAAVRLPPLEASGFVRLPLRQAALVLLASFGTMWLLQGLNELQPPFLEWLGLGKAVRREKEFLLQGLKSAQDGGTLFTALLYGVVSPLCEETLFRGLVFRGLAQRSGPLLPLALTTVLFAAIHGTWVQFALMFVLGLYFGVLRWLTGSLWAGILAHAANNFAVLILSARYGPDMDAIRGPWWVYPLSAIVFAGAMLLLVLDRRGKAVTSP